MEADAPKRRNGRTVALGLILLCAVGFSGTVWNYSHTHPFANEAKLISPDTVLAEFPRDSGVQAGQRAVVSLPGRGARGGTVLKLSGAGCASIRLDSEVSAPAGTKVRVNIDGTVSPQPAK